MRDTPTQVTGAAVATVHRLLWVEERNGEDTKPGFVFSPLLAGNERVYGLLVVKFGTFPPQ